MIGNITRIGSYIVARIATIARIDGIADSRWGFHKYSGTASFIKGTDSPEYVASALS